MKKTTLLFSLFLALFSTEAASKPRLPQFISDCMLLQRDTENRIWGWAEPGVVIWYRKSIDVPESMAGRHAKIYLGRMVDGDEVYVNGTLVGSTGYFGPPRKYDIPAGLLHKGRNVITVRLPANGPGCRIRAGQALQAGG